MSLFIFIFVFHQMNLFIFIFVFLEEKSVVITGANLDPSSSTSDLELVELCYRGLKDSEKENSVRILLEF